MLTGGSAGSDRGFFVEPTIVAGVGQQSRSSSARSSARSSPCSGCEDAGEAFALANDVPYGLAASVWTRDTGTAMEAIRQLDFGCVWINDHLPFLSEMPHGGFKESGYGKDLSVYALEDYTRVKHAMIKLELGTADSPSLVDDVRTTEHDFDTLEEAAVRVRAAEARAEAAEQVLRHQTLHDPLTNLPNRALLLDRLRLAVARRRRAQTWVAVLYLDVDDFKGINDSLGQAAGDEFLRTLAPRLSEVLRPSDTLARLGGDEFAILCEGLDEVTESAAIAERLLAVVAEPVEIAGVQLRPSASIGIALTGPGMVNDGEDLVRDGGVAMYRARAGGHGRYSIFDDHMRAETVERVALTRDLRRAIEDGDLRLVYQPMVRFAEGRTHAFEALARWTHPQRGEIPPDRFISLAEQHGLIEPLGRWVLHEAVDQLRRWRDAGLPLGAMEMSINVSRVQLSRRGFAEQIFAVLAERGIAPRQLVVEVTESAVMDDPAVANATLDALAQAGVRIALDDFGVGQSSLACLRDLPLDALKLDRGFITSLASSREAAAIVRAVCDMARTLGFSVVAEGVETGAQSQVVEALGCDIGQGFLYARPVPPQEIPDVVAELDRRLGMPADADAGIDAVRFG